MFLIGEFSQIARVSRRMLYYYEELGLLEPAYIDDETGYRYYSAAQIPRLNQILALKKLGLTLEQVRRMLNDRVSTDEIRGMLAMKKAQIEQQLEDELAQIRAIESHIRQIDVDGVLENYDVVLKSVPEQPALTCREIVPDLPSFAPPMFEMMRVLPSEVGKHNLKNMVIVLYTDGFETEAIDAEVGYILNSPIQGQLMCGERQLSPTTLPAMEQVASITRIGPTPYAGIYYQMIGQWMETHHYRLAGPCREVFLELQPGKVEEMVVEVQFPVQKVTSLGAEMPLLT